MMPMVSHSSSEILLTSVDTLAIACSRPGNDDLNIDVQGETSWQLNIGVRLWRKSQSRDHERTAWRHREVAAAPKVQ